MGTVGPIARLRELLPRGTPGDTGPAAASATRLVPHIARWILLLVLGGFGLLAIDGILHGGGSAAARATGVGSVLALMVLQAWCSGDEGARLPARAAHLLLPLQAALVAAPALAGASPWPGVPGFLAGSALLLCPPVVGVVLFLAVTVAVALLDALSAGGGESPLRVVVVVVATMMVGLVVFGLTIMRGLLHEAFRAREELRRSAAVEERLRVARDVHDMLGASLSAVCLKSELVARLLPRDLDAARTELSDVLVTARRALGEVRAVVEGRHTLDLAHECRDAERTLAAAGVRVTVVGPAGERSGAAPALLATVLREGVTNVLRHARPTWCRVEVGDDGGVMSLSVTNDGVAAAPVVVPEQRSGQGLENLARRAEEADGVLTASSEGDVHHLRVDVPRRRPG